MDDVLFQDVDVRLEAVEFTAEVLEVVAAACGPPHKCPGCRARARRVHSCYERSLAERPLSGKKLLVRLRVRPFFCDRAACRRRTFVEQVSGLSERYRRASLGLKAWLYQVAVELGGRPGERLCRRMHLTAGRTRLLELLVPPPVPQRAPRVLGVDEFAFRRGRAYGTILVDVEAGQVVDVLPDRTSETFAAWLREHPDAEIICRDRASAYTRAIKEAAPDAVEVTDRWHLLQNLASAVEKTCHQHRACLRKRVDEVTSRIPEAPPLMQLPLHELPRTPIIDRTRHRHADVQKLVAAGWTISAIARRLHLDRKTVRRFRDTDLDQLLASANERQPAGVLDPFKPYLNTRFTESLGQVSGSHLFLEICERGYRGSRQVVRKHLTALRAGHTEPIRADIPSPRKITSWIMRPRDSLPPELERRLLDVRIACPDIARACDLAHAFAELLRHRRGFLLNEWIRQAEQDAPKPISGFAGFLRQDLAAVTAGLTLHWSSGIVEGHVNRVKTLN
ncbi:hypothetical protein ADK34_39275 [Streptomyces viridochromogenes]|uniref:HTH IS21-type domain-containing protein n=1 Tax=Streptomyces viridochromogenes TaxID=1938 RepID=A0A0L8J3J7_STRVR|nr:hypothetical protein ADK34_39275 [Streptomyces viridochromogenes]